MKAIVIGAGPNGLVAGCVLAGAGLDVLVLEAHPDRAGGAVASEAATRPGFVHDVGAGFFPWGTLSPAFTGLPLAEHGLRWRWAELESCHPGPAGDCASIGRDDAVTARLLGEPRDGDRWQRVVRWYRAIESRLADLLLGDIPRAAPLARLGPGHLTQLARVFLSSGRGLAERWFAGDAARRVMPGLGLHVDVGPDDRFGAGLGFMLAMTAATRGFPVPEGGAGALAAALVGCLRERGGRVRLGAVVTRVLVRGGRVHGVRLAGGEEVEARVVLADTDVAALLLGLVGPEHLPSRVAEFMYRYPRGWGTLKVDWALSGPVPWTAEPARRSAVVHVGDDVDDLSRFTRQVRAGYLPDNPYLVVGQQSLADPTRAPAGCHTLWAYTRVPQQVPGGWAAHAEAVADRIDRRLEDLAPGFRSRILARRVITPEGLEVMNPNLVGGDLGGGSNHWRRQLLFRPLFPWFRYRMPVAGLYLCSSYAHPGAGVHGMCGHNAARRALEDVA